jgi:Concanavalin A-like lectin/glucanases superfamily
VAESIDNPIGRTDDFWIHSWQKVDDNSTAMLSIGHSSFGTNWFSSQFRTASFTCNIRGSSPGAGTTDTLLLTNLSRVVKGNEWTCVSICVVAQDTLKLYINGVLRGTKALTIHTWPSSTKYVRLGALNNAYYTCTFGILRIQNGGDVTTSLPAERFYAETKKFYTRQPEDISNPRWFGLGSLIFRRTMLNNLRVGNRGESE